MKVLQTLDSLNRGGAEMLALDVCRNARANNLELTFIATGGGDLETEFRNSGADFIRLQRKLPVDLSLSRELRKIIRERDIEVVHAHQAVEALHLYLATRGTKVKRVLTTHGWIRTHKNILSTKLVMPLMHANICVSNHLLKRLESDERINTKKNFHVLYNGVDAKRLRTQNARTLRHELKLAEQEILFGMVGNFYFNLRDQLTICKALPQFFACFPNAHFAFIGGRSDAAPQLYDDCVNFCREHRLTNRTHFIGKRANVEDVLSSLDAFVFSSLYEGMPIAVIEAMMMKVPALVSDIAPLLEVSGEGAYASTFRAGDAVDLSAQLIELATHATQRMQLAERAKKWAVERFSIETHIANLNKLYTDLLQMP